MIEKDLHRSYGMIIYSGFFIFLLPIIDKLEGHIRLDMTMPKEIVD